MGTGPVAPIPAPPAAPARVGLVASAVRPELDGASRWPVGGIEFTPEPGDRGVNIDPCSRATVTPTADPDVVNHEPMAVVASMTCTTLQHRARDWEAKMRRRLQAARETQISSEFWTGDLATSAGWPNLFLASTDSDDITEGAAVPLTDGLACLQQHLAETNGGQRGMIHATRQVITHWSSLNLLRREGSIIFDLFDNIVVPGAGYDGSSPEGRAASDGDVWAYATGMVQLLLGDIEVYGGPNRDGVDRDVNDVKIFAEQPAIAYWDGLAHGAVRLDVDVCAIGGS